MYAGRSSQPVRVPPELQGVSPYVLEQYVRDRLSQFAAGLKLHIAQQVPQEVFDREVSNTYTELPPPDYGSVALENRELQLVFRHDCRALGCSSEGCSLCQHNPQRRCEVNFDKKYLVSDSLKAKCGAVIRVELVDRASGQVFMEEISGLELEMSILDGNEYDQQVLDRKLSPEQEQRQLMKCVLDVNKKQSQLLVSGVGVVRSERGKLVAPFEGSRMELPELSVTDSSEALLTGRKPPFRLLVMAVDNQRRNLNIRHAVSEGFVVATRRTRSAGKVDIPSIDDHISKLDHMGKETVKKLLSIRKAAEQAHIQISLPVDWPDLIERVGEFKRLAQAAEQDGSLRQKLQQVLKLSKEKWEEARDHAMKAVVPDNRMRAWYSNLRNDQQGLLFTCRMGIIELERPVALLHKHDHTIQAILLDQLDPRQREEVRSLLSEAVEAWWRPNHPGWSLCAYDSEVFSQSGCLEPVGALPDMPLPGSPQRMRRTTVGGGNVSRPTTPPQAVQMHLPAATNAQSISPPENVPDTRIRISTEAPERLVSERIIPNPSTSNPACAEHQNPDLEHEDQTFTVFANGLASLPSLSSSFLNRARAGPSEPDALQPAFEMSWNLTSSLGLINGNDFPVIPNSMELPDNPEEVYPHHHLDGNPSAGLQSMQSVEESLEIVARGIDGQRSMEGISFSSHGAA